MKREENFNHQRKNILMAKIKSNRKIIIIALILGAIGTILFCPIKMESGDTCLFHRIFGEDIKYIPDHVPSMEKAHLMLQRYLVPFGLVWWLSLGVLVLSVYQLKVLKHKSEEQLCK